jgi:hypothetical protein
VIGTTQVQLSQCRVYKCDVLRVEASRVVLMRLGCGDPNLSHAALRAAELQ